MGDAWRVAASRSAPLLQPLDDEVLNASFQDLCFVIESYVRAVRADRTEDEVHAVMAKLPAISAGFGTSVHHLYTYLQSSRLQART